MQSSTIMLQYSVDVRIIPRWTTTLVQSALPWILLGIKEKSCYFIGIYLKLKYLTLRRFHRLGGVLVFLHNDFDLRIWSGTAGLCADKHKQVLSIADLEGNVRCGRYSSKHVSYKNSRSACTRTHQPSYSFSNKEEVFFLLLSWVFKNCFYRIKF